MHPSNMNNSDDAPPAIHSFYPSTPAPISTQPYSSQEDAQRMRNFFKETSRVPFESLPTVLVTGLAVLDANTGIKAKNLFDNVPIYEIPGYRRGNNKQVKIPYPGLPYVVLAAEWGGEIRGIVKDMNKLVKKEGNKGKFPNQVSMDISLKDRVVNVFIFPSSIKVAGATKAEHLVEAFIFIKSLLCMMQKNGVHVFDQSPILTKINMYMENVVFDLGFSIKKDALIKKAIEDGAQSPPEKDAVRVLYPTGSQKAKGGERYFNFRVMHTGKVVFSGTNRKEMEPYYNHFMDFIQNNEAEIRFA